MLVSNSKGKVDVSILIVYYSNELVLETIQAVYDAKPAVSFEIIVADNNAKLGMGARIQARFPEVKYVDNGANLGFAKGMNAAYKLAGGRHILVYNPDILLQSGTLENLVGFLDAHEDVGIVGPQLRNEDGSLQLSMYRMPSWVTPAVRRTPLQKTTFGRKELARYFMEDNAHDSVQDVDSMLGAALLVRREAWEAIGGFDGRYTLYYEDNDICRMMWKAGYRVVYLPEAVMMHYYRRLTADGGFWRQIKSPMTWVQIASFLKYKLKYLGEPNPREVYLSQHGTINT